MRTKGRRGHLFAIWRLSLAIWAFFAATAWSAPRLNRIERVEVVQESGERAAQLLDH